MRFLKTALLLWAISTGAAHADYFTEAIATDLEDAQLQVERLAVAEVTLLSGEQDEVCRLYRERLTADLRQRTRYVIVARENLEALLQEIEMSQSDLGSGERQLEVGRMLGAEALVDLTIAELPEGTEIFARLTEVETARVLYARSFRDFAAEPAAARQPARAVGAGGAAAGGDAAGESFDPQAELSPQDYGAAASPTDAPSTLPARVIRLDEAERAQRLGAAQRAELLRNREQVEVNSLLYRLKFENPELYRALAEARRGLNVILRDRELFLLFVFHSRELGDRLRQQHPLVGRRMYPRFQRIRQENPGKDAFVRGYLARYGRLVHKDRLLAEMVRKRFETFVNER